MSLFRAVQDGVEDGVTRALDNTLPKLFERVANAARYRALMDAADFIRQKGGDSSWIEALEAAAERARAKLTAPS